MRREEGARGQQRHQQGQKNRRAKRNAECDNSLVGGLQSLVDRMAKPTFSGDPLVRLKQFIEAAEKDTKSPERTRANNVRMFEMRAPVVAVDSVVRTLWRGLLLV